MGNFKAFPMNMCKEHHMKGLASNEAYAHEFAHVFGHGSLTKHARMLSALPTSAHPDLDPAHNLVPS